MTCDYVATAFTALFPPTVLNSFLNSFVVCVTTWKIPAFHLRDPTFPLAQGLRVLQFRWWQMSPSTMEWVIQEPLLDYLAVHTAERLGIYAASQQFTIL